MVIPALFDEANKLRRFTVEVMRRLDLSGIDCILPDLPGCNDSTAPLEAQTLGSWRKAASVAAAHFSVTHILAIRGGALIAPANLPGWRFASVEGKKLLRNMLRARTVAAREAGREERMDDLQQQARADGTELAGWHLGAQMFRDLDAAVPKAAANQIEIDQELIGGRPLWLRAEPDEDHEQADALAAAIAVGISAA